MRLRQLLSVGFILVLVAWSCRPAEAGPGMLTQIQQMYAGAIPPLQGVSQTLSGQIFAGVFTLETMWVAYECVLKTNSVEDVINRLIMLVVTFALGSYLVTHQTELANEATTALPQIAASYFLPGTNQGANLNPDGIAALGDTASGSIAEAEGNNPVVNLVLAPISTVAGLFVSGAFCVISVEALAGTLGTQFVLAIGSIMLGFVGCRWTRPFAAKYLSFVISAGVLLIAIDAVASIAVLASGVLTAMATGLAADAANGVVGMRTDLEAIAGGGFTLLMLAFAIPSLAAWLSQSPPVRGAGEALMGGIASVTNIAMSAGSAAAAAGAGASDAASIATLRAATRLD